MSFQRHGAEALGYEPVAYDGSSLRFRGPRVDLSRAHVLCLGGTETFGRFLPDPFPSRLAGMLDMPVANLGVAGGGLDVIMEDAAIRAAMGRARAIVLQVPGAHALNNRFYTVHPRRNDRFVKASGALRAIYRDVDFTEFHFTRHLLSHLKAVSPSRFSVVREELGLAWQARMAEVLEFCDAPVHLLWLSLRNPGMALPVEGLGEEPLFVSSKMLEAVAGKAASLSIVPVGNLTGAAATDGMQFAPGEAEAARHLPGPQAHAAAATALAAHLGKV